MQHRVSLDLVCHNISMHVGSNYSILFEYDSMTVMFFVHACSYLSRPASVAGHFQERSFAWQLIVHETMLPRFQWVNLIVFFGFDGFQDYSRCLHWENARQQCQKSAATFEWNGNEFCKKPWKTEPDAQKRSLCKTCSKDWKTKPDGEKRSLARYFIFWFIHFGGASSLNVHVNPSNNVIICHSRACVDVKAKIFKTQLSPLTRICMLYRGDALFIAGDARYENALEHVVARLMTHTSWEITRVQHRCNMMLLEGALSPGVVLRPCWFGSRDPLASKVISAWPVDLTRMLPLRSS